LPSKKTSISAEAKNALQPLYEQYFTLESALASDNFEKAKKAGAEMKTALSKVNMNAFKGESHTIWMQHSSALNEHLQHINHNGDIDALRLSFISISKYMITLTESFDPFDGTIYLQHCPMADSNKGADWLSLEKEIRNPYFGEAMLTCGETKKTIK
jgi:Cu(I)/Ag(I) efflux system membrane fusion protein